MRPLPPRRWAAILLSFIAALALTIAPLPEAIENWRPEWVALTLIYWSMAVPQRIGVGAGWLLGLVLDILRSGLLGQQALALACVAYLTHQFHRRLRIFPLWQKALAVLVLIGLQEVIQAWVNGLAGLDVNAAAYLLPPLASALVWPAVFVVLRRVRRLQHIR